MESAEILQRELHIPLSVEDSLRERVHGPLEGQLVVPCSGHTDFLTKIADREGVVAFIRRVEQGFERIAKLYADRKVIVVTHGGVIKVFHGAVLREHVERIEHASVFLVELGINAAGRSLASRYVGSFSVEDENGAL